MYTLNNIRDNKGARTNKKILGRGIGSGLGKTSGKGHKGQSARNGCAMNGFEGGQTPIYRRLPKRGFTNIFRIPTYELDFNKINRFVENGILAKDEILDLNFLLKNKLAPKYIKQISLINNGTLKTPVKLKITRASKTAKEALASAGGTLEIE